MSQVKFHVKGMQCGGCETIIKTAVTSLKGVEQVTANYSSGLVEVSFDDKKLSLKEIQKVIEASGYLVESKKNK